MQCCPSMVDTTLHGLFSSQKLFFSYRLTLHRWFPCAMLTQTDSSNTAHCRLFFHGNLVVGCGPKCASNFLVQCWLRSIKTTFYMVIFQKIDEDVVLVNIAPIIFLSNVVSDVLWQNCVYNIHWQCYSIWNNIAQVNTLGSVVLEAPDNIAQEKILLNVALNLLGQHCTGNVQCCPGASRQIWKIDKFEKFCSMLS